MIPRLRNDILTPLKTTDGQSGGQMKINLTKSQMQHLQSGGKTSDQQKLDPVKEEFNDDNDDVDFF